MLCCECGKKIGEKQGAYIQNFGGMAQTCLGCYRMGNDIFGKYYEFGKGKLRSLMINWFQFDYVENKDS